MSKTSQIAQLLGADEASARIFCSEVQNLCKPRGATYKEIAAVLASNPDFKSQPEQVAEKIKGMPILPKQTPPKGPQSSGGRGGDKNWQSRHEWLYGDWTTD